MITLAEARDIAGGWAHRQSFRRGYECTPHVDELTLGFAVWMRLPPQVRTQPGEDLTTIIDRETGRLTQWPPAPFDELDRLYTERRPAVIGPHRTSDPIAELRREAHRRVSPSVAAHVTLGGRLFRARGAKGDQELVHHPLVAQLLEAIPPPARIRGAERHAELLVVSDVLYAADKTRTSDALAPLSLDEARVLLSHGGFETFHIREEGDPRGGKPAPPCATCSAILVELGLMPASDRVHRANHVIRRLTSGDDPQPGRFPAEVAWELAARNWGRSERAEWYLAYLQDPTDAEHPVREFPAAREAFLQFHDTGPDRNGPGQAQRVRWFQIGSGSIAGMGDPLHDLSRVVGARLFPLGTEGFDEAILAIDERGRVFSLDQGGEWFVGETLDEAIIALVMGLPAARIRDDGTWRSQQ
ncbi:SUKH-3 domain-containing protein [Actinoplanes sp. G11-F43]|uniref:SUKH-3 domain-containing protein n=1 Tax=Actinoplanes sp. G11-F43 TaxID=3424130 RepID=UPI003D33AE03